jgi:hypothetical protein
MIRRFSAAAALAAAAILFVAPRLVTAGDAEPLKPGAWKLIKRGSAPEWKGDGWAEYRNDKYASHGNRGVYAHWDEAAPDKFGNKPAKYILLFSKFIDSNAENPFQDKDSAKAWMNLTNTTMQGDYIIECAPDVRSFFDLNSTKTTAGFWSFCWVLVEYSNGKRALTNGATLDTAYEPPASMPANTIKFPEDYKWAGDAAAAAPPAAGGDKPAGGPIGAKEWRVYKRGSCPEYKGEAWYTTAARYASHGSRGVLGRWGEYGPDKFGNKVVKHVLLFSKFIDSNAENPFETADKMKDWCSLKNTTMQGDWMIECGSEVRSFLDLNSTKETAGFWSFCWLLLEYSNGKRAYTDGPNLDTANEPPSQLPDNCMRFPEDYKWTAEQTGGK